MKTALAIVELDDNDHCLPQPPINLIEVANPNEIMEKLNVLLDGYPVRDAAYNALLKVRFLAEKLYQDTANPNDPTTGYTNVVLFVLLSNWDKVIGQLKDGIKKRHKARLDASTGAMDRVKNMAQNTKESTGMNMVFTALEFFKDFTQGRISEDFNPGEFEAVIHTLQGNKLLYTAELRDVSNSLLAVFSNPDAGFEDVEKINTFFQKAHEGIEFLEKSEF